MTDKLKTFIQDHQQELDVMEPSQELWKKIDAGMDLNRTNWIKSKWLSGLKYIGFSASVLLLAFFIYKNVQKETVAESKSESGEVKKSIKEITEPVKEKKEESVKIEAAISLAKIKNENINEENSLPDNEIQTALLPFKLTGAVSSDEQSAEPVSQNEPVVYKNEVLPQDLKTKTFDKHRSIVDTMFRDIKRLEINGAFFDINVKGTTDAEVKMHGEIYSESHGIVLNKRNYKIRYEKKDSVLIVTVEGSLGNTLIVGTLRQETVLNFSVPSATEVEINNGSGDITVESLKGKLCKIKSNFGNVKVTDVQSDIELKLTSGDASLSAIAGNIKTEASFGDQLYENINGNLMLTSSSGDIRVKKVTGNLNVVSTYGDVRLDDAKGNNIISVQSGDIIGKNVEVTDMSQLKTKYGDIKMSLKNELKDLSFDIETVYGQLKIDKNGEVYKSEDKLQIKQGRIMISGTSQSGDQYYQ